MSLMALDQSLSHETGGVGFYDAGVTACPTCPVPAVGTSFIFPCHLGGLVIRRCNHWIRWTDPPSTFSHCAYFPGHLFQRLPWFWIASSSLLSMLDIVNYRCFWQARSCGSSPVLTCPFVSWFLCVLSEPLSSCCLARQALNLSSLD